MASFNKDTKVWSRPALVSTFNTNQNLGQCVLFALNLSVNDVVQISADTGVELTGGEIRTRTIRVAQNLKLIGIKEKDVIAIAATMSEHVAPVLFGSFLIGAPVNTLDPEFQVADYVNMFRQTKPKIIFSDSENLETIQKSLQEIELESTIVVLNEMVADYPHISELYQKRGSDLIFTSPVIKDPENYILAITCSSGTTGFSKGVMISHQAYLQNPIIKFDDDESVILTGSVYWLSILRAVINTTLAKNRRIISRQVFEPKVHMKYIEKYRPKYMVLSPTRLSLMLQHPHFENYDLSSLKIIGTGGSVLYPSLLEKINKALPKTAIWCMYGASEVTNPICTGMANPKKPGSPGQVMDGNEIKIADEHGNALDIGEQGEIWVRRKIMFSGYYGMPEKRAEVIDKDGWYHTGDVGYFDEDGYIYIVDRIKDIILYKNFWIAPAQLEEKIMAIKGVKLAVVVGIPDEVCVDLPAAVVIRDECKSITEEDIKKVVAENFADAKQLRGGVYFVNQIPMTPNGKIKRKDVKAVAIEMFKNSKNMKRNVRQGD